MLEKLLQWDRDIFIYLNGLGVEKYDAFWSIVTNFNTWIPLFLLMMYLFFRKFSKKEALLMIATLLLMVACATLLTYLTKDAITRLRPNNNEEFNALIRIIRNPSDYSFFSGHASSSFSITTLVFLFLRKVVKWSWLFYIWPLMFAASRIYVGVHYPLDLLVGAFVGIVLAYLTYKLYKRFITPYSGSDHL